MNFLAFCGFGKHKYTCENCKYNDEYNDESKKTTEIKCRTCLTPKAYRVRDFNDMMPLNWQPK